MSHLYIHFTKFYSMKLSVTLMLQGKCLEMPFNSDRMWHLICHDTCELTVSQSSCVLRVRGQNLVAKIIFRNKSEYVFTEFSSDFMWIYILHSWFPDMGFALHALGIDLKIFPELVQSIGFVMYYMCTSQHHTMVRTYIVLYHPDESCETLALNLKYFLKILSLLALSGSNISMFG